VAVSDIVGVITITIADASVHVIVMDTTIAHVTAADDHVYAEIIIWNWFIYSCGFYVKGGIAASDIKISVSIYNRCDILMA